MPDDVGGISVSFTAEASQLQSELKRLEERLRAFDRAHGQQRVRLNADFQTPGQRRMDDFRRDVQQGVASKPIMAQVKLAPPSAADVNAFRTRLQAQLGSKPIVVRITPQIDQRELAAIRGGGGGGGGGTDTALAVSPSRGTTTKTGKHEADLRAQQRDAERAARRANEQSSVAGSPPPVGKTISGVAATGIAAATNRKEELVARERSRLSREEYRRRERLAREAEEAAPRPGAAGYYDPYRSSQLSERRRAMREANAIRLGQPASFWSGRGGRDDIPAAPSLTAEQRAERDAWLRQAIPGPRPGGRGLTGGATGVFGPTLPQAALYGTTGITPPSSAQVGAMARAGQVSLPARDVYDAYGKRAVEPKPATAGGLAKAGLTEEVLAQNLRRVLDKATPESIAAGKGWYQRAGELTQSVAAGSGVGRTQAAAATAVFSSNAAWEKNIRQAQSFFEALKSGARTLEEVLPQMKSLGRDTPTRDNIQKALDVAFAPSESAIEQRLAWSRKGSTGGDNPKIRSFWRGLMGDPTAATIDRHQAMMMSGGQFKNPLDQRAADPFQRALATVAAERGWSTADTQAISWTTVLGHEIAGADPHGMIAAGQRVGRTTPAAQQVAMDPRRGIFGTGSTPTPYPGDIYGEGGLTAAGHQTHAARPQLEAAGRRFGIAGQMYARVRPEWGGFTVDPRTGQFIEKEPGRSQGPYVAASGRTVSMPVSASEEEFRRKLEELEAIPENAQQLARGGYVGGFHDVETGRIDLDVAQVFQTRRQAQQFLAGRPDQRGAYNMGTGFGVFPRGQSPRGRGGMRMPAGFAGAGRWASRPQMLAAGVTPEKMEELGYLGRIATPDVGEAENLDVPTFLRQRAVPAQQPAQAAAYVGGGDQRPPGMGRESLSDALAGTPARGGATDTAAGPPVFADGGGDDPLLQQAALLRRQGAAGENVRGFGTMISQRLNALLGGGAGRQLQLAEIGQLESAYKRAGQVVEAAAGAAAKAKQEFSEMPDGLQPAEVAKYQDAWDGAKESLEQAQNTHASLRKDLQSAVNAYNAQGSALKTLGIGFVGAMTGMVVFQTGMKAVGAVGESLVEVADRVTDFRMTAERTAPELGKMVRQFNGFAEGAVAASMAQTGLGGSVASQIQPLLQQRAIVEAGNAAFSERLALIRSAQYFENNPQAGITQTTGGFLGTAIGGQQPFFEQLLQTGSPVGGPIDQMGKRLGMGMAAGMAIGATLGTVAPGAGTLAGGAVGAGLGGLAGLISHGMAVVTGTDAASTFAERYRSGDLTDREHDDVTSFQRAVASSNEAAMRAAPNIARAARAVSYLGEEAGVGADAVEATARYFEAQGQQGQADAARAMRFAIVDPRTGQAADPTGWARAALQGGTIPDSSLVAAQQARQYHAQIQMAQWQGNFQRETVIPGRAFMSQLAQGRITGTGQRRTSPEIVTAQQAGQYGVDLSGLQGARSDLADRGSAGMDAMLDQMRQADRQLDRLGQNRGAQSLVSGFSAAASAAAETAGRIRDISRAGQAMQFGLQLKQIAEQSRVMSRSLGDAESFISGLASNRTGGGALGVLQNQARAIEVESAQLGFQSTDLGLRRNQARINAQRAIAGFAAPGATGEERAARMRYAELEASLAQQEQDIGVQQAALARDRFGNQQAQIDVQATRAVEDLNNQLTLLNESARVTIQLQVDSERLEAERMKLEEELAVVESYVQQSANIITGFASAQAAMVAAVGGFMSEHATKILKAFDEYLENLNLRTEAATDRLRRGRRRGPTGNTLSGDSGTGAYGPNPTGGGGWASGFFGNVSGATSMIVGEAGPETVAILRNPRTHSFPPSNGGGGVNIQITVTGNTLGGDQQDAEAFAAMIARRVEETMNRRSSLTGLRGPN